MEDYNLDIIKEFKKDFEKDFENLTNKNNIYTTTTCNKPNNINIESLINEFNKYKLNIDKKEICVSNKLIEDKIYIILNKYICMNYYIYNLIKKELTKDIPKELSNITFDSFCGIPIYFSDEKLSYYFEELNKKLSIKYNFNSVNTNNNICNEQANDCTFKFYSRINFFK